MTCPSVTVIPHCQCYLSVSENIIMVFWTQLKWIHTDGSYFIVSRLAKSKTQLGEDSLPHTTSALFSQFKGYIILLLLILQ